MRIAYNISMIDCNSYIFQFYKKHLGLPFKKIIQKMGIKNDDQIIIYDSFFSKKNLSKIKIKKKHLRNFKLFKKKL